MDNDKLFEGLELLHCAKHEYHAIGCLECAKVSNDEFIRRLKPMTGPEAIDYVKVRDV